MKRTVNLWQAIGAALVMGFAANTDARAAINRSVYGDFYLGPSFTASSDIDGLGSPQISFKSVGYKTSFNVGGKIGYWHNAYFGGALDIFSYSATPKDQTVELAFGSRETSFGFSQDNADYSTTAIGLTALARYPINDKFFPYIGIGPAFYMNDVESVAGHTDDSATNIGFEAPIGFQATLFEKNNLSLGLFGELQFVYNPTDITVDGTDVKNTLFSTNLHFGVSMGFNL